jgi:hypothetical protein
MLIVQLVSNGLYAVQIGRPAEAFSYMFDIRTALKPYHTIDPSLPDIQFPGQLAITCTTYIPSLFFYLTCLLIVCLMPFYWILIWFLSIFNLESGRETADCSQLNFIGLLTGIGAVAMASAGLFVGTWAFIRPS